MKSSIFELVQLEYQKLYNQKKKVGTIFDLYMELIKIIEKDLHNFSNEKVYFSILTLKSFESYYSVLGEHQTKDTFSQILKKIKLNRKESEFIYTLNAKKLVILSGEKTILDLKDRILSTQLMINNISNAIEIQSKIYDFQKPLEEFLFELENNF